MGPYVLGLIFMCWGGRTLDGKQRSLNSCPSSSAIKLVYKGIQLIRRMRNKRLSVSLRELTLPSYSHISSVIPPQASSSHWSPLKLLGQAELFLTHSLCACCSLYLVLHSPLLWHLFYLLHSAKFQCFPKWFLSFLLPEE